MGAWSEYGRLGIWGMWREFFASSSDWVLAVEFAGRRLLVNGRAGSLATGESLGLHEVFSWNSVQGLSVALRAGSEVSASAADLWSLLLHYESAKSDCRPSFCPFSVAGTQGGVDANGLLVSPGQVLVLTGQPGVGKRTLLHGLSLLHAGRLAELQPQSLNHWATPSGGVWIVPELAMLEADVQQRILVEVEKGARLWAATAYDIALLRTRKIISPAFADLVAERRLHLPPVARWSTAETQALVDFWQAFHGQQQARQHANAEFLKQRSLTGAQLSVASILEEGRGLRGVIAEFEKEAIRQAHERVGRSQHKIARLLKVSRGSLQHKLRKYQFESYAPADADNEEETAP